jgi:GT2 family glycosyltransferase
LSFDKASVIILNYNGLRNLGKILEDCVESVLKTDYPNFEVLFVDNGSTDGSVDFIRERYSSNKRLHIIQNEENLGFAEGNNSGTRNAKGTYVALVNTDARVEPSWLKELVKAIQPADIGAAQSKLLLMESPNLMDCAGGFIDYYGYHHFEVGYKQEANKYNRSYEIFYAKGAGMIIKKEVFKSAGMFDPKIFMYFDETDLCWRVRLNGYKVIFVPTSLVYHANKIIASSLQEKTQVYFSTRNHLLVILKNCNSENLLKVTVVSIIWEIRNIAKFVLKRKPHLIVAIVKALLWNLTNFQYVWEKRQITQKIVRKVPDEIIRKSMLKPYPPFPLSLIFSRFRYLKRQSK